MTAPLAAVVFIPTGDHAGPPLWFWIAMPVLIAVIVWGAWLRHRGRM